MVALVEFGSRSIATGPIAIILIGLALVCGCMGSPSIELLDDYLKEKGVDVARNPAEALNRVHEMLANEKEHLGIVKSLVGTVKSCSETAQCDRMDEISGFAKDAPGDRRVDKLMAYVAKRMAEQCGASIQEEASKSLLELQQLHIGYLNRLKKETILANSIPAWYMGPYLDISLHSWMQFVEILLQENPPTQYTSALIKSELSETCKHYHQLTAAPIQRLYRLGTFAMGKPEGVEMDWPKVFDKMPQQLQDIIYRNYLCQTAISNSEIVLKRISDGLNNHENSNKLDANRALNLADVSIKVD